jgi:hypothetical protein
MVPATMTLLGRTRFNLRRLRCSTDSRASTTIEDFLIQLLGATGSKLLPLVGTVLGTLP